MTSDQRSDRHRRSDPVRRGQPLAKTEHHGLRVTALRRIELRARMTRFGRSRCSTTRFSSTYRRAAGFVSLGDAQQPASTTMEARPGARLSETAARGILRTEDGIGCRPRSSAPFSSAYRCAVVVPDLHIARPRGLRSCARTSLLSFSEASMVAAARRRSPSTGFQEQPYPEGGKYRGYGARELHQTPCK